MLESKTFQVKKKTWKVIISNLGMVEAELQIPLSGANGAVMATNVSYTVASVIYLVVFSRITGMPLTALFRFRKDDWSFLRRFFRKII